MNHQKILFLLLTVPYLELIQGWSWRYNILLIHIQCPKTLKFQLVKVGSQKQCIFNLVVFYFVCQKEDLVEATMNA